MCHKVLPDSTGKAADVKDREKLGKKCIFKDSAGL